MASLGNWAIWSYGWGGWTDSPVSNAVGVESAIYSSKGRTCVQVNLDGLSNATRATITLNVTLLIAHYYPSNLGRVTGLGAILSTIAPISGNPTPWTGGNYTNVYSYIDHTSVGATPTVSITFDSSWLPAYAQQVYIYLYGTDQGSQAAFQYKVQSATISEATSLVYTNVTTGIIHGGSTIYLPGQKTDADWTAGSDGINNPITSYTAYLKYDETIVQTQTGISPGARSHWFTLKDAPRGATVKTGVQAIGAHGNGSIEWIGRGYINTIPPKPTASTGGTNNINMSTSITYQISAGYDPIGGDKYYYYSLNGSSWINCSSSIKITTSTSGVKAGTNEIKFLVSDGLENSPESDTYTFTAVFKPIIHSASCTHVNVKDMNNNSSLTTTSTIKFSLSAGSSSSIKLYVRTGSSSSLSGNGSEVSSSYYSYNNSTKTATVSIINLPDNLVAPGNYFQFRLAVSDGTTVSDIYPDWLTIGRRPKKIDQNRLPKYVGNNNHSSSENAKKNYYKDYVTITQTNQSASDGYAAISSIKIVAYYNNTSQEYSCSIENGKNFSTKLNLTQVNPNTSTSFKFKITDAAGQSVISSSSFLTLTKTSNLVYSTGNTRVSHSIIKPYSNNSNFQFGHPPASATGTNSIIYTYKLKISNIEKSISKYSQTSTNAEIIITIQSEEINQLIFDLATNQNKNTEYAATLTVTATDGFGQTFPLSQNFKIDFRESPTIINKNFKIRHDYNIGGSGANGQIGIEVPQFTISNWESQKDKLMFNMGEGIIFSMPRAQDLNGENDITEYRIYLSRNDFNSYDQIQPVNRISFGSTPWLTLSYRDLERDSSYLYYRHRASQYTKNEYFYFGFQVKDSTGNFSEIVPCPYCIIGCRVVNPIISAENITVTRKGTITNLSYNLKINDLGGSAKSSGWNKDFYSLYPNFQRSIQIGEVTYKPKASLVVKISSDPDFKDKTAIKTSTPILINSEDWLKDSISCNSIIEGYDPLQTKIFIQFIFTASYGLNLSKNENLATIESSPWGYSYFDTVPTVAHRANKIGVNTKIIGEDEVLVIENFKKQVKIVLKGATESNNNTIEIDLTTGAIKGLTVNCGGW